MHGFKRIGQHFYPDHSPAPEALPRLKRIGKHDYHAGIGNDISASSYEAEPVLKEEIVLNETVHLETVQKLDSSHEPLLKWWSEQTKKEKHMLPETPESLRRGLLCAVFVRNQKGRIIAAAGLFPGRNKQSLPIMQGGMLVAELGSNIIDPSYRGRDLAAHLVKARLDFCRRKNLFAVSVTTNPIMQRVLARYGRPMDDRPELDKLRQELCLCEDGAGHENCPLLPNGGWYF